MTDRHFPPAQPLSCRWTILRHLHDQLLLLHVLLGKQIDGVRQADLNSKTFLCFLFVAAEGGINHKPGRQFVGVGLIENKVILFWLHAKAYLGKLHVNCIVQRLVREDASIRNREASRFQRNGERLQGVVIVFDPAASTFPGRLYHILINQWPYSLSKYRQDGNENKKTYGPENTVPGPMSKGQKT